MRIQVRHGSDADPQCEARGGRPALHAVGRRGRLLRAAARPGTDIAFLGGVINYLIANDKIHWDYVKAYTNVGYVLREDYKFEDGLFSGYNAESAATTGRPGSTNSARTATRSSTRRCSTRAACGS
jgi:hypothetical protein